MQASKEKSPGEIAKAKELAHIPWGEQYERMISGMLYDSFLSELTNARFKARAWAHKYNHYFPEGEDASFDTLEKTRLEMIRDIVGKVKGGEVIIEPPFAIDYGCNISLGDRFYANFGLVVLDCALVTIGDRVMCGPNVSILTATHETDVQSRRNNIEYAKPITIGNDCWIGANAVILPGVTIGDGCTIAASAVVTKDIPSWSVVMGTPARVVRNVTPPGDKEASVP